MRAADLDLEGRADEDPLSVEELSALAKVASAGAEVSAALVACKTVGELRKVEARIEELDKEIDAL